MVRVRPTLPSGHGEVLTTPPIEEWATLVRSNAAAREAWTFEVAGVGVGDLLALARHEALAAAEGFSARLGVPTRPPLGPSRPIVMTGHQPEFYHPGVWVKAFLLERVAAESEASAIDLVVDSDGFESVSIHAPCLSPAISRCEFVLAEGGQDSCYACTPAPETGQIEAFVHSGACALASLRSPAIGHHFERFGRLLLESAVEANNVAELVTFARRRFEANAGTGYLELPVTLLAASRAFTTFVCDLAMHAGRFVDAYNSELAEYRAITKTRSAAQPFPDLACRDGRYELPLWSLRDGSRETVWVEPGADGGFTLFAGDNVLVAARGDVTETIDAVLDDGRVLAPKAVLLTLFNRLFVADLFIHGVGGARYDRVTDGVARRYFGVELPPFAVASMTMYLPLGVHLVTEEEVVRASGRVNTFEHNPDSLLDEVDFEHASERDAAVALASEKAELVSEIARTGVDRKALGARIREVNRELREALAPFGDELRAELERLREERAIAEVLTDRTYPFCFWSAEEIADKVR